MKKITRKDIKGLIDTFPVFEEEDMRKILGGATVEEIENYLMSNLGNRGSYYQDGSGNMFWSSSATMYANGQSDGIYDGGTLPTLTVYGKAQPGTFLNGNYFKSLSDYVMSLKGNYWDTVLEQALGWSSRGIVSLFSMGGALIKEKIRELQLQAVANAIEVSPSGPVYVSLRDMGTHPDLLNYEVRVISITENRVIATSKGAFLQDGTFVYYGY